MQRKYLGDTYEVANSDWVNRFVLWVQADDSSPYIPGVIAGVTWFVLGVLGMALHLPSLGSLSAVIAAALIMTLMAFLLFWVMTKLLEDWTSRRFDREREKVSEARIRYRPKRMAKPAQPAPPPEETTVTLPPEEVVDVPQSSWKPIIRLPEKRPR